MSGVLRTAAIVAAAVAAAVVPLRSASQSDLDAFMERVLARRDENWTKMQQYVLDEEARLQVTGPDGGRIYGFHRNYTWFIREGIFVRSPVAFDGVIIGEEERARYEHRWIARERARARRADASAGNASPSSADGENQDAPGGPGERVADVVSGALEPRFVSAAYFLRFKFDPGHYALAGREDWDGREVLKIEYYPSRLFTEGRTRPDRRVREREDEIEEKMNKVSLVTLWIDRQTHQILRYTFESTGMDFMPGRSIVRIDELQASMHMTEPFPGVWLPGGIQMRFALTTALGPLAAQYHVSYHGYRLAKVTSAVRPPP